MKRPDLISKSLAHMTPLMDTMRDPFLVLDSDLRIIKASRSFYAAFMVEPEETVGQLIYNLGNKQWDIPKLRELLETILPQKAIFNDYLVEHHFPTIGLRIMLLNARQIDMEPSKEQIILLSIEDITDRKRAELTVQNAMEDVEAIIATIREPLLVLDKDLRVTTASRSFCENFQVTQEETEGQLVYNLGNKQWDIPKLRELLEKILPTNAVFSGYEVDHNFEDIGRKIMLLNARKIYREGNQIEKILLAFEDITDRKSIEMGLETTRKELAVIKKIADSAHEFAESLINTIREPLISLDQDLRVVTVSRSFYEFFQVKPEETVGQLIYDLGNKQWDIPKLRELLEKILPQQSSFDNYEVEHDFATIGRRTMLLNGRQIKQVMGKERIILLAIEDITEMSKKVEENIKQLAKFPSENPNPVLRVNRDGIVTYANPIAFLLLKEWECQEGSRLPEDLCLLVLEALENDLNKTIESAINGHVFFLNFTPVIEGAYVNIYGHDITDLKKAEEGKANLESKLQQAYKMDAIGTLAGGIAHDFNNLLTIIVGYAELIREDSSNESNVQESIEQVQLAASRATLLVRQILSFSRQTEHELVPIKLQSIVKESLKLLRASIPRTIEIIQDIAPQCGVVNADPTQINQILMNLCTNAMHAMDEHGVLKAILQEINLDAEALKFQPGMEPGCFVQLSVSDTGTGMVPETIARIFDPFYTTKEIGKGTGMGLSVVHGVVEDHGGFITVESEPGQGSTFNVFFPVTKKEEFLVVETSAQFETGTERILLVDDEEGLLEMVTKMLKNLGYEVIAENSSIKALEIFKSNPDQFDLIITDQAMPNMSGSEIVIEILKVKPDIPIILCSGYSSKISSENASAKGISKYIAKPYNKRILAKAIREVLNGKV